MPVWPFFWNISDSTEHIPLDLTGLLQYTKTKLRGFSPQANYTDRPSERSLSAKLVPTLADRGVAWSAQRIPTAVISVF
jgi:hypothetical protein